MLCDAVRASLAVIRPDSGDVDLPELAAEMRHLSECADCQAAWEAQQRADRELGRAMRQVTVPGDLKARLISQLTSATRSASSGATAGVESKVAKTPVTTTVPDPRREESAIAPRQWTRRQLTTIASCALLVLACLGLWFFQTRHVPTVALDQLIALGNSPDSDQIPAFEKSFAVNTAEAGVRVPSRSQPKSLQYSNREIGARFTFLTPGAGRQRLEAVLVVIDLRKVAVPDLASVGSSFAGAQVEYPKPAQYATRIWKTGERLYICYVRSHDPGFLERLLPQAVTA